MRASEVYITFSVVNLLRGMSGTSFKYIKSLLVQKNSNVIAEFSPRNLSQTQESNFIMLRHLKMKYLTNYHLEYCLFGLGATSRPCSLFDRTSEFSIYNSQKCVEV